MAVSKAKTVEKLSKAILAALDQPLIADEGRRDAHIVLIGEFPDRFCTAKGRPFMGYKGARLHEWWEEVGLNRQDFFLTHVFPYAPPSNKLNAVPKKILNHWIEKLHERLASLKDPYVIVPTGNVALKALTGKNGITKYRGSVLSYKDRKGRLIKVIPTLDPSMMFAEKKAGTERTIKTDWARIAGDSKFRERKVIKRKITIFPTISEIRAFTRKALKAEAMAVDIETPGRKVACVGFAINRHSAICIPFSKKLRPYIEKLLTSDVPKVFQNGHFDTYYLDIEGITVRNWKWDTLAMHHCLDSTLPHDLAYMASVDTRQPYWKDEAKDPEKIKKYAGHTEALYTYNGLDACVTYELYTVYKKRIIENGRLGFYERHYVDMFQPLLRIMRNGIPVVAGAREAAFQMHREARTELRVELNALAGFDLYGPKGSLVPQRLQKFLYEGMKLPKQFKRGKAAQTRKDGKLSLTTDEIALRRLQLRYPLRTGNVIRLILEDRRHARLMDFLKAQAVDGDKRFRASYRFTTETGRLSSGKNPRNTGGNLQNIDREVRYLYRPLPGHIMLECDLSQAEDRVVKMLTRSPQLIALARKMPWEFDVHTYNASRIFQIKLAAVTGDQRYLGKRVVHASNYGMGAMNLSEQLLKDDYIRTVEECQEMIDDYFAGDGSAILDWHRDVRKLIMREGVLVNTWGRQLDLSPYQLNDALYRRCYAFVPQSEVADLLNQWGLIPLHAWIEGHTHAPGVLHAQVHDSVVLSLRPSVVYDAMQLLHTHLNRPRLYYGEEMLIPPTYKLGARWGDKGKKDEPGYRKYTHEFKQFPTREEVEERTQTLLKEVA